MTLLFLNYVLPLLAGYAIFMMISGQFLPLRKPSLLAARPSWLLGLWFGLSACLVTMLTLQMVNPLAANELKPALIPSAVLLALLLMPGIAVYSWYRSLLRQEQAASWTQVFPQIEFVVDDIDAAALPPEPDFSNSVQSTQLNEPDTQAARYDLDETLNADPGLVASDDVYDVAFEREYNRLINVSSAEWSNEAAIADEHAIFVNNLIATKVPNESAATESATQANDLNDSTSVVKQAMAELPAVANAAVAGAEDSAAPTVACDEQQLELDVGELASVATEPAPAGSADTPEFNMAFDLSYQQTVDAIYAQSQLTLAIEPEPAPSPLEATEYSLAFDDFLLRTTESIEAAAAAVKKRQVETPGLDTLPSIKSTALLDDQTIELESARIEVLVVTELLSREREMKLQFDRLTQQALRTQEAKAGIAIKDANQAARGENRLRLETEKHLRITRRALLRLEADARTHESSKTDELIELEQQLEEKIKIAAQAESALLREQKLRSSVEQDLIGTKQAVLAARTDARKNTAARAKVLATANKAIAFARHTVDARSRVESELQKLKDQIKMHQATISSLIATLDHEKSKSREEVSFLSKQLMQKEIELEKKSIGAGYLTSRLVKKVARAKTRELNP